jgi:hypothetical protein
MSPDIILACQESPAPSPLALKPRAPLRDCNVWRKAMNIATKIRCVGELMRELLRALRREELATSRSKTSGTREERPAPQGVRQRRQDTLSALPLGRAGARWYCEAAGHARDDTGLFRPIRNNAIGGRLPAE